MYQLHTYNLPFDNGFFHSTLYWCGLIAILSGISLLIVKNPIGSLICLIAVYGFISIFLMFIGLTFIGFSYMIVYIGAVSILFLFILMLIDVRTSELQINNWNSIPLASFILLFLNFTLTEGLPQNNYSSIREIILIMIKNLFYHDEVVIYPDIIKIKHLDIWYVTSNNWDGNITETSHISAIGNILYTSYSIWLLITSIILLLAMVGAIVVTVKKKSYLGKLAQLVELLYYTQGVIGSSPLFPKIL
jgi:NADH-ubiquinone oxidoreductase chain 6